MAKKKRTLSISQAAEQLKISRQAVYEAIKRRALEATKKKVTATVWRIDAESVRAYKVSDLAVYFGKKADKKALAA